MRRDALPWAQSFITELVVMLEHWRMGAAILLSFVIGQINPIGLLYWKLAEWRLPQIHAESLAHPKPFESIPRSE